MKNHEFWFTKKCLVKEFISEFIYEFMKNEFMIFENDEFIYEFMKKTYELGCTKCVTSKNSYNRIHI